MYRINIALLLAVCALVGCGGGSGGGSDPAVPTSSISSLGTSSSLTSGQQSVSSISLSSVASSSFAEASSSTGLSSVAVSSLADVSSTMVSSSSSVGVSSSVRSSLPLVATPAKVAFTAWVGDVDAVVDIDASANGMEFVRTKAAQCDISRYQECESAAVDVLAGDSVVDTTLTLGGHAYYGLKNGVDVAGLMVGTDKFLGRDGAEVFVFNNKLWLIGGSQLGYKADIWSSVDGVNWKRELEQAAFSPRKYHRIVSFNNQLWLIGGLTDNGRANDIWSSVDGINWVMRSEHAAFSARYGSIIFSFSGKLWLVGGEASDTLNDIWSSSDGINWNKEVDAAPFGPRSDMQITPFNNQLILTGGYTTAAKNDVWVSTDGINWSLAVEHAAFSERYAHTVHQANGKLWLTGGGFLADIWFSTDGLSWELAPFVLPEGQMEHKVVALNNELFMLGGFLRENIWASPNSTDWIAKTSRANIPDACRYFEWAGQHYATNGTDTLWQANSLMDWSSEPIVTPIPVQSLCDLVVHNNKLYVVGGFAVVGQYRNDIWRSDDGKSWSQITPNAEFSPRTEQALVSFKGRLWAAGGYNANQSFDEVWSSVDGSEWVKATSLGFSTDGLIYSKLFVFQNRLWFIFNYLTLGNVRQPLKAYSSVDGEVWQAEPLGDLVVKNDFVIAVKDEHLLLFSSNRDDRSQWTSNDGNNWSLEPGLVPFLMTDFFTLDGKSLAIGYPVSTDGATLHIDHSRQLWTPGNDFQWRRAYSGQFVFNLNE